MKLGTLSVWHIAFLTWALLLLSVPISRAVVRELSIDGQDAALLARATFFVLCILMVCLVAPLRRATGRLLAIPVPSSRRAEVALVAVGSIALAFAYAALLAIWIWATEGPAGVDRRITVAVDTELVKAFSPAGLVMSLVLIPLVAPIVEEIIFRGFLYQAIERRWGALVAAVGTSALFGLYHPHFYAAFTTAVVLVCVLRRTGSLWGPIVVHATVNLALWWPLTGQFIFPHGVVASDPWSWRFHAVCLVLAVILLPIYIWMSRDRNESAPTVLLEPNGALSK